MVVAVVAVRMVQMPVHQVVDMITMRHRLMAAARTMDMVCGMSTAVMFGRADVRIRRAHCDDMLVDMIPVRMVQMTIVQVIDMALVHHRGVTTARSVLMGMVRMVRFVASRHGHLLKFRCIVEIMRTPPHA